MALTRDFKETINARVQKDSQFTIALLDEAIFLFLNGEPETARLPNAVISAISSAVDCSGCGERYDICFYVLLSE